MGYDAVLSLEEQLDLAVETLLTSGIVAFPTDTIYGLGAVFDDTRAVRRIYQIKRRLPVKALPLIVADYRQLEDVARQVNHAARCLMEAFWPGPLTLVLAKSDKVSDDITGGLDTVAVRMPNHYVPLQLAKRTGRAICGTSANISGGRNLLSAGEIHDELGHGVDFVITAGEAGSGEASTIVYAADEKPRIIRHGALSSEQLNKVCKIN
jgi:L-threonylcarbamoyladenylate synthase